MSKRSDIEAMISSTIEQGNDHMDTLQGAVYGDEWHAAAAHRLAESWENLVRLTNSLIRETK